MVHNLSSRPLYLPASRGETGSVVQSELCFGNTEGAGKATAAMQRFFEQIVFYGEPELATWPSLVSGLSGFQAERGLPQQHKEMLPVMKLESPCKAGMIQPLNRRRDGRKEATCKS